MELTGTNRSRALLKQRKTLSRMCNKYIYLLCGFQSTNSDRFSGDGYEDPPVPISNTVVKLINAESTWLETAWEDRKPLIKLKAHLRVCLFLLYHLFPNVSCTELRSSEGKSIMSIDRNLSLVVEKMIFFIRLFS